MTARRWLFVLIASTLAMRLAVAFGLGPGNDEAYYAQYTRHLDWCYDDHPPAVAWLAWLSNRATGSSGSIAGMRLGFVVLFAASTCLMFRITTRWYGERAGLLSALALTLAWYHGIAVGTFILPDGPLLFFWLLTIDRLAIALEQPSSIRAWALVGLACGGAFLSKYHAIFLAAGIAAFVLVSPSARQRVSLLSLIVAFVAAGVAFAPVLVWNANHDWASFRFQGGRIEPGSGQVALNLLTSLAGPILYLLPWVWWGMVGAILTSIHRWRRGVADDAERLCLTLCAGPIAAFTLIGLAQPVFPHWAQVGWASLMPLVGHRWARALESHPAPTSRRLITAGLVPASLAALFLVHARTGLLQQAEGKLLGVVRPADDPTLDLYGWDQIATQIRARGLLHREGTFVFTSRWHTAGQMALSLGPQVPVVCYHSGDARGFARWSRPDDWIGRDGLLVALDRRSTEPACFDRWFERIEPAGEFSIMRGGQPIRQVRLFRAVGQKHAFPFDRETGASAASLASAENRSRRER